MIRANRPAPKVFLSYATEDRAQVMQLQQALLERGVASFLDCLDIRAGDNVVLAINEALSTSDYFVLVWSATADAKAKAGDGWIGQEWSAAFVLERFAPQVRPFLFVVRLDETRPPPLLLSRRYLDAYGGNLRGVADELARVWQHDRDQPFQVVPAPVPAPGEVQIYVRNHELGWASEVAVAATPTVEQLDQRIRRSLQLQDEMRIPGGHRGWLLSYRYRLADGPVPEDRSARLRLSTGANVDVVVLAQFFDADGLQPAVAYLGGPGDLSSRALRALAGRTFRALMP